MCTTVFFMVTQVDTILISTHIISTDAYIKCLLALDK